MQKKGISWDEGALLVRLLMHVDWDSGIVLTSFLDPFTKQPVFIPATSKEVIRIAGRSKLTVLKLLRSLEQKNIIERIRLDGRSLGVRINLEHLQPERIRAMLAN
ncbi:MAG: hypothetical protein AB1330_10585 [Bacillota bacterium]